MLEAASRIAWNQRTSTPTKGYVRALVDRGYHHAVPFPEDPRALETAEQLIEWCVAHQRQPWVEDIPALLHESPIPMRTLGLHIVFLETQSGATPVMTLTYHPSNDTLIVAKGWSDRGGYAASTVVTTEAFAVALLANQGDRTLVVKAIIQNYDGAVKLITE